MTMGGNILRTVGGASILAAETAREVFRRPLYLGLILEQIYQVGLRSLPVVAVTALAIGSIMALQFGITLEKFGGALYVPKIVSLSIVREMGPVFTSFMIAARVGAGMASEIGSMVVTQQIDAIRALGTSVVKKIVIPRVVALMICLPLLAAMANVIGIMGGLAVSVNDLGLDASFFWMKVYETVELRDYLNGIGKAFFFSFIISIVACHYGLSVRGGTQSVGIATTKSVVTSSILIVIGDFFLTKIFWLVELWLF
jgi:phospholipid/cholesterol/gamma-HCH transport system permease protein